MLKRICLLLAIVLTISQVMNAQVTTSSIIGTVKDASGKGLPGATVKATHVPSGTTYTIITQQDGRFTISNMKVGGPYMLVASYVGYNSKSYNDLNLELGTPLTLNVILEDNTKTLTEVTVTSQRGALISAQRTGPSTQISQQELQSLPTITRNIDDFTRLVPQAQPRRNNTDGSTMGVSFAGQSNRYNQFTVDGANSTDVFGLAASGTNGGQAALNPLPFDAIEQVQIILAPYDVTLSGFTGGGVNAVSRSGSNTFHGSVYGFRQDQSMVGKSIDTKLPYSDFFQNTYGVRLGGPIIKNKLFFFVNYEGEKRSQPIDYLPGSPTSKVRTTALDSLSGFLKDESKHPGWSYDPGAYNGFNKDKNSNSIFGRIDWNISPKHKLTFRHSYVKGSNFAFSDAVSSASFYNNGYNFNSTTNSSVVELNSTFTSKFANMLRLTYTDTRDSRATPGSLFPAVKISDNGATYNFGTEYSSQANSLNQKDFSLTDNLNIYKGRHTITLGTDNLFYNSENVFLQGLVGSYSYSTAKSFYDDASGVSTAFSNSYQTAYSTDLKNPRPIAKVHAAQLGFYAQDAYGITDNFKLTYGVRADVPIFLSKPAANDQFNGSNIAVANNVATNKVPKSSVLVSPRIGFNWDVTGKRETQVRGGVGIFTGRVPFVWVSNQYSNTGIGTISGSLNAAQISANKVHFNPVSPYQPTSSGLPYIVNTTDPNFKYPRTLRTNLALDQKLPLGFIGTIEGIYTNILQDISYTDINLAPSTTNLVLGNTTRPFYGSRINSSFANVLNLGNTNQGYSYNLTVGITRPAYKGWSGSLAYSLGHSYGLNDGGSSVALSNWRYNYNINGLNNLDLARNNYDQGSRIIGRIQKRFKYGRFGTNIGLVYTGQSGQTFSYVYYGDFNGDDGSTAAKISTAGGADLIYLPSDASQFVTKNGLTPQQQFDAFTTFMNSDEYMKSHIGQNTTRNADRLPWENHFDLKIEETIGIVGTHTLSVSANIFNVGNLLNEKWGKAYYLSNQEVQPITLDHFETQTDGTIKPMYYFNPTFGLNTYTNKPWTYSNYGSRWSMQIGLRYSF